MTEAPQTESPASVEGAAAGQVLGNLEHSDFNMSVAFVEAEAARKSLPPSISANHRLALELAEVCQVFAADPTPKKDRPDQPKKTPLFVCSWRREATKNPAVHARWWGARPDALVAVPCVAAKILVVDCDVKGGVDGVGAFEALVRECGLPSGVVKVRTLSGGLHYIFAQPDGDPLGNSPGSLPAGIDIRGAGGFIIAPGTSWHGGSWQEVEGSPLLLDALRDGTLPPPPEWLLERLRGHRAGDPLPLQPEDRAPLSERAKASAPAYDGNHAGGDKRRYVEMALDYIPSDSRDIWLKVGGALHDSGEPWARAVWDEWARRSSKFNAADQAKTWASFDRPTGRKATIGSIIFMAQERGFTTRLHDRGPEVPAEYLKMAQDFIGKLQGASEAGDDDKADDTGGDEGVDDNISGVWFDGDSEPEPVPTIVDELIPARGLTFLGGQSGAGKSFLAIDLGVALATNQPFCNRETEEGLGVIYVAGEGRKTISPRLAAAKIGRGVDSKIPFAVIREVPDLAVGKERAVFIVKLTKVAKRLHEQFGVRVGIVILDTLAACFGVKDENSAAEMNAVCKAAAELGDAIRAATLVVAHYGKDQSTGLRGSSALRGAGESVLAVLCKRNDDTADVKNRRLVHVKSRSGPEGAIFHFELEHVHLGFDPKGRPFGDAKIVAKESEETGGQSRRLTRGEKVYLDALNIRADQAEKIRPYGYGGPEVPAVDREAVRAEFNAAYVVDGDDDAARKATKQKAFKRGEDSLLNRKAICTREVNGKSYVWLVSETDTDNGQGAPL